MRDFLAKFASDLTSPYSEQLKADLQRLVDRVNSHKFEFLAKLNELSPPNQTMTEFEKQQWSLKGSNWNYNKNYLLQEKAGDTKRDEAQAVAKPLKKLMLEKCRG